VTNNIDKEHDPFAEREAQKYEKPVPSREFILEKLQELPSPASLKSICKVFEISDEDSIEGIRRRLKAMVRDEQLVRGDKFGFALIGSVQTEQPLAKSKPRNKDGAKFKKDKYKPETSKTINKDSKDRKLIEAKVILDRQNQLWAMPLKGGSKISLGIGDQRKLSVGNKIVVSVAANAIKQFGNEVISGVLVDIVEKQELIVTGRYQETPYPHVVPFSRDVHQDIMVSDANELEPQQDQIVVVELINNLDADELKGVVIEILGTDETKGIEVMSAIRQYDLPFEWPDEVLEQVLDVPTSIPAEVIAKRVDLRHLPLITIDGEDARDFDDAVYCERNAAGFKLYVAIADVSFYVKTDSPLDIEAKIRGNSVYFPSRVIPMLPEKLSNNMCSLMPEIDRLCMVCEMDISEAGSVSEYKFYEAVMHSKARLTYTKVAMILEQDDDILKRQYKDVLPVIINLEQVYNVLNVARQKRGAIDFDTIETKVVFGKDGKIADIIPIKRNVAHKIIEECMLVANVTTAAFLETNESLSLYRNHDGPSVEKLPDLKTFLRALGLSLGAKGENVTPLDYGTLLSSIKERPDYKIIQTVLLRSLSQAVYSPDNIGHFGLAYEAYTHFTSPIRRYPDLIVHRQIKSVLRKAKEKLSQEDLIKIALNCSQTERRADDATRDVLSRLKCIFMKDKVGQEFNGVISGVTRFGLFVEIEDFYIDGLVHISDLGTDFFHYNQIHHKLEGENTGEVYALGMPVKVTVAAVNADDNKIDLNLVHQKPGRKAKKK
jgi:ribonuclease R